MGYESQKKETYLWRNSKGEQKLNIKQILNREV